MSRKTIIIGSIILIVAAFITANIVKDKSNIASFSKLPEPPPPPPKYWGIYTDSGEKTTSASIEQLLGKQSTIFPMFWGWDSNFPNTLSQVGDRTLLIYWEPAFGFDEILSGRMDPYIEHFAMDAKAYGKNIILVPFPEMNLNEEAWGFGNNNNTADKFIVAWKHTKDIFYRVEAQNVKFGLAYNHVSIPDQKGNDLADYYPGDEYVDYVGVDGFNFGDPWQNFDEIFAQALKEVKAHGKPIYIFSTASAAGSKKADWVRDAFIQMPKYGIEGWIWFNVHKEQDWRIDSDKESLEAFKNALP